MAFPDCGDDMRSAPTVSPWPFRLVLVLALVWAVQSDDRSTHPDASYMVEHRP